MRKLRLTEGMRAGDLANLVLPLISCDEYESKVDAKEAVVIGFYVHDEDAAKDLNRFVQKSAIPLLDTEVSPAPDQHGYYLVFVEMLNNDRLGENVKAILDEVTPLADIDQWRMRVRKSDGLLEFSPKALMEALKDADRTDEEAILEYLMPSDLAGARFDEGDLMVQTAGGTVRCQVLGFGARDGLVEALGLSDAALRLSMCEALSTNRFARNLGSGWTVQKLVDTLLIAAPGADRCLAIKI